MLKFMIKVLGAIVCAITAITFCGLLWEGLSIIVGGWFFKVALQWGVVIPLAYVLTTISKKVIDKALD